MTPRHIRTVLRLFSCVWLGLAASPVFAHPAFQSSPPYLIDALCKEDARLQTRVTVRHKRIRIGELLEEVSAQTRIPISAGARDGAADTAIAVFCTDVPLAQLLNGLWSLMSYRGAEWTWQRSGEPGRYAYSLSVPLAARRLREKLQNWTQDQFERNARTLMEAVDGTDADRRRALEEIYGRSDIGDASLLPERVWADIRAFKRALNPSQQKVVLREGTPVEAPIDSIDSNSREYLLGAWKQVTDDSRIVGPDGISRRLPEPSAIRFQKVRFLSTPALCVNLVAASSASPFEIGGVPLELDFRKYLSSLWLLPMDQTENDALNQTMVRPQVTAPSDSAAKPGTGADTRIPDRTEEALDRLGARLEEVSASLRIPVIARLPEELPYTSLSEPWNSTLRDFWKQLWNQPLMVKWHEGVHLVSTQEWVVEDPPVPLYFVRDLRKHAKPDELLPFDDLVRAAGILSAAQLRRLSREFPVMQSVADAQGILQLFFRHPDLVRQALTAQGAQINDRVANALRPLLPKQLWENVESGRARILSIKIISQDDPKARQRDIVLQLRDADGKYITGYGFRDRPQPGTSGRH